MLEYLWSCFSKMAVLGLVFAMVVKYVVPFLQPVQELTIWFLNNSVFILLPYSVDRLLLSLFVAASTFMMTVWIFDPKMPLIPNFLHSHFGEARAEEAKAHDHEEELSAQPQIRYQSDNDEIPMEHGPDNHIMQNTDLPQFLDDELDILDIDYDDN